MRSHVVRLHGMNAGKPVVPDMVERMERALMGTAVVAGVIWYVLGETGVLRLAAVLRVL